MDTVTIQLKHINARKLLKDLEDMDIIKIIEQPFENNEQEKPSKLRGFLSKEKANALLSHVEETRREWEERFPSK